jgi:Peptide N-acetyl-beta-D-glucosaminyl asparaginase amidase A
MRRITTIASLAAAFLLGGAAAVHAAAPAIAAEPPAEFGTDWDDPRTAAPPVEKPPTRSCTVQIVDHKFVNFDNYVNTFTPPAACAGRWTKVVLHLDGAVKGRQFDRLGWLTIGDVMVFKTSTPEPSADGITWSVEKDISGYAPLLRSPQTVIMFLGNVVNDTFTGVLDIKVFLTFYTTDRRNPAVSTATDVLPLASARQDGADLTGTVTVPRNTERLIAEVYATGSGGGCEEFWYLTAPPASGYSCPADNGPYREVQVLLDGRVAGIAAPFPHVYTGGWSNPFLWYVVPAPRAFDIRPLTYDLSPYLGLLTDGAPHTVAVHVVGVPAGQPGWHTPINFLAWRDPGSRQVTGQLAVHEVGPLANDSIVTMDGDSHVVTTKAGHALHAAGFVRTSHGPVVTVIAQRLGNDSTHRWGPDENPDQLRATWTDESSTVVAGRSTFAGLTRAEQRYTIDGGISVAADNRLTTTITMTDAATMVAGLRSSTLDDTYRGEASFTLGVPRDQRHAVGTSQERYRLGGDRCFDHLIETRNGFVTTDMRRC